MSVESAPGVVRLIGDCPVEDAEALVAALHEEPAADLDLSDCRRMHAAVAQVLLAFRRRLRDVAQQSFLRDFLTPALGLTENKA